MPTLTVTAKGQVTLRKDVLRHLGVAPGQKIEVDKLPDGRVMLRASTAAGAIENVFDALRNKTDRRLSLDDIGRIAAQGWAGKR